MPGYTLQRCLVGYGQGIHLVHQALEKVLDYIILRFLRERLEMRIASRQMRFRHWRDLTP